MHSDMHTAAQIHYQLSAQWADTAITFAYRALMTIVSFSKSISASQHICIHNVEPGRLSLLGRKQLDSVSSLSLL